MLLAWIGVVALAVCVVCLVVAHFLPTGFHPLFDPVSFYGTSRYHALYQMQAVSSGVSALCLVAALAMQGVMLPKRGVIVLALYGVSRVLIAGFPADLSRPSTQHGRIHVVLAAVAFTGIAIATGVLTSHLTTQSTWHGDASLLSVASLITDISAVVFFVATLVPATRRSIGLPERGIYVGALLWLGSALVPLALMR